MTNAFVPGALTNGTCQQPLSLEELKQRYGLLSPADMKASTVARTPYIVDGLLPEQSVTIAVGDSGIGKSPFFFQLGMCVAAGLPFLGRGTSAGRVLYLDFENGLQDANVLTMQLAGYLGTQ